MRKNVFCRIIGTLCAVILAVSMIPVAAIVATASGETEYLFKPDCDISIMSFNILDAESAGSFRPTSERKAYVIDTILKYQPDIVGIQEAGEPEGYNEYTNWVTELKSGLGGTYTGRSLKDDNSSYTMNVANGLVIFWKTSRFTRSTSAAVQYSGISSTYQGNTITDNGRYYQYVKLFDNTCNTNLYVFNTHLSIPPNLDGDSSVTTESEQNMAAVFRTMQIDQLKSKMAELATDTPCFATGDYNCRFSASNEDPTAADAQLNRMAYNTPFRSSAVVAKYNYPKGSLINSVIDHCFVNTNYTEVLARDVIYRDYNGWQPSDHRAVMTYANYCAAASFGEETPYDAAAEPITDTTDATTYPLTVTPVDSDFTYKIYNESGSVVTSPLSLAKPVNRFTVKFFNSKATGNTTRVFSTVNVTIRSTARTTPGAITCANAENAWYEPANNAYHIAVSEATLSVTPVIAGATLYKNAACTTSQSTPVPLVVGRNTVYAKIGTSVYPVYIDREQITQKPANTLFVDSGLTGLEAGETGVYRDHEGVRLVTVGTDGFATIAAAIAKAKANGAIYVAPGTYKENVSVSGDKKLSIYGNNRNVSPIDRSSDEWALNESRLEETYMDGQFTVTQSSATGSVDIHGFYMIGTTAQGSFVVNVSSNSRRCVTNFSKNILTGSTTNQTNGSLLWFNSNSLKDGKIFDNYIGPTHDHLSNTLRVMTLRNSDGLILDNNLFFKSQDFFITSEPWSGSLFAGNLNITFSYNHIEQSTWIPFYMSHVSEDTSANIRVLYNKFHRCSYPTSSYLMGFYLNPSTTSGAPELDYGNISVTVFGNRIAECNRGFGVNRSTSTFAGDARESKIVFQNNSFTDTNQSRSDHDITVNGFMGNALDVYNVAMPNWKITHNYFRSNFVNHDNGTALPGDTLSHFYDKVTVGDDVVKRYTNISGTPYFTNEAMTTLSSGSLSSLTGVSVGQTFYDYDGTAKSPVLNTPADSIISWSTDGTLYSCIAPERTAPGNTSVYYRVEKAGYTANSGQLTLTVDQPYITGVTMPESTTLPYTGANQTVVPNGLKAGDTVTYSLTNSSYSAMPAMCNVGTYTLYAKVQREGYKNLIVSGSVTITPVEIDKSSFYVLGYSGIADGSGHTVTVYGTQAGDTLTYSTDGVTFTSALPSFTAVGEYTVYVKLERANYLPATADAKVRLSKALANPLFTLSLLSYNMTKTEPALERSSMEWTFGLAGTDAFYNSTKDIKVLSYGMLYASSIEALDGFVYNAEHGLDTTAYASSVVEYAWRESDLGISQLTSSFSFRLNKIKKGKARAVAPYIRYEVDGELYTEYGTVSAGTTMLDGFISGIGPTKSYTDGLDD